MSEPWQIALFTAFAGAVLQTILREATPYIKSGAKQLAKDAVFILLVILTAMTVGGSFFAGRHVFREIMGDVDLFDQAIASAEPAGHFVFFIAFESAFLFAILVGALYFSYETAKLWLGWIKERRAVEPAAASRS